MRRREFISTISGAAGWPLATRAQEGDRAKRLGILMATTDTDANVETLNAMFLRELAQLGWMEGRNLRVDFRRVGSNDPDVIRPHAVALVRAAPDVIYATPAGAVRG